MVFINPAVRLYLVGFMLFINVGIRHNATLQAQVTDISGTECQGRGLKSFGMGISVVLFASGMFLFNCSAIIDSGRS